MTPCLLLLAICVALFPMVGFAAEPGTDSHANSGPAWSPYLVGALIGVLSMLTFYFSNKPLGASTAYARLGGMIGRAVAPTHTASLMHVHHVTEDAGPHPTSAE